MFGDNKMRPIERDPTQLAVQEVFYTIQGEGPFSGQPCIFVRLAGCNLACYWCDTEFESNIRNLRSLPHVLKDVDFACQFQDGRRKLVVLTGGEPLRQNVAAFIDMLLRSGTERVQIETAGTVWQDSFDAILTDARVTLVCSPKTNKVRPEIEQRCFHWKYVVSHDDVDPADGLPIKGTQRANKNKESGIFRPSHIDDLTTIWVSPRDDHNEEVNRLNREHATALCLQYGYRLSLQTHKIVNLP